MPATTTDSSITFVWLDLTQRCPLECLHCYADAGPMMGHGSMSAHDWERAIDQAAAAGVRAVCMIGGEPAASRSVSGSSP